MIDNVQFVSVREFADRLMENPLLQNVTLEQIVRKVIDFTSVVHLANFYLEQEATVKILNHRGLMPCDVIQVNLVRDCDTGLCLKAMRSTFLCNTLELPAFRCKGRVIFTTMKDGEVQVQYRAIPVDEEGYPMIIDDPLYQITLEDYIKVCFYTNYFDLGLINANVLQNAQLEYCFRVGLLKSRYLTPSVSEMLSLANDWNEVVVDLRKFYKGFEDLGNRTELKIHNGHAIKKSII